jgi:SnoaL-like protein
MTDVLTDFHILAERYVAAWNETDPAARRRAVDELYNEDARYVDPLVDARGREAIDATIAAAQAQFPGFVLRLAGPVDTHHDVARSTWELVPADSQNGTEAPVVGFDVAATDGHGRLRAVDVSPSSDRRHARPTGSPAVGSEVRRLAVASGPHLTPRRLRGAAVARSLDLGKSSCTCRWQPVS